jgi:hypothetical protein
MNNSHRLIWLAVIVAAIAIVAVVVISLVKKQSNETTPPTQQNQNQDQQTGKKTEVPTSQLPARFPADIPLEAGAQITQNYNADGPEGQYQASRVFISKQTLDANLATYQAYFKAKGWKVGATINEANYKFITGTKDNAQLQVTAQLANGQKTVTISYTELPK